MDKRKRMIVSLVVGVVSFFGIVSYMKLTRQKLLHEADMVGVLIASKDILIHAQLEEDMVSMTEVPRKYLQPETINRIGDAIGQVVSAPIKAGEQILKTKLVKYGSDVGLSSKLAPGYRALAISVDEVSGVASLVKPDDYVDIFALFDFGNQTQSQKYVYLLFENVQVLAVNQNLGGAYASLVAKGDPSKIDQLVNSSGLGGKTTYTFALTPEDAQHLVLAQEAGTLTVALRPTGEADSKLHLPALTPTELTGIKGLMRQSKPRYMEYRGGRP